MKRRLIPAALALFTFTACADTTEPIPALLSITPDTVLVEVGDTVRLFATVVNAGLPLVTWTSADSGIAYPDATGLVTGVASGIVRIHAHLASDASIRDSTRVRVVPPPDPEEPLSPDTLAVLGLGAVTERYTAEVAVRGDWAYTTTWGFRTASGNTIKIWNVSGATPVLVDTVRVTSASTLGDVQISDDGGLLVVAVEPNPNGAIVIFDRSSPASLVEITRYATAHTAQGVHTVKLGRVGDRHFAFLSIDPGANPARLVIVDITDPAQPFEVFSQVMGNPYVHDVFVRDGILMTALWHDGLRIYDIGGGGLGGTPETPVLTGKIFPASGSIHNIWWFHDEAGSKRYAFLGEEGPGSVGANTASGDIHVIDVSDLTNPAQVAIYHLAGAGTHNFSMDEASGILYAAYYNGGVRALDVLGDLGTCDTEDRTGAFCDLRKMGREAAVALTDDAFVWGVAWQSGIVYASDMRDGLYKLDATGLQP